MLKILMLKNIQQTKIAVTKKLAFSSNHKTYNIGTYAQSLLQLQLSNYDFEPTFIICFVIRRVLPDQPK